jgi:hypothetical protein
MKRIEDVRALIDRAQAVAEQVFTVPVQDTLTLIFQRMHTVTESDENIIARFSQAYACAKAVRPEPTQGLVMSYFVKLSEEDDARNHRQPVMNGERFVLAMKNYVERPAVEGTLKSLKDPPGRSKHIHTERTKWFSELTEQDLKFLTEAISDAAQNTLFGLLVALDGARAIDEEKGEFELYYRTENYWTLLNPEYDDLHDFYPND